MVRAQAGGRILKILHVVPTYLPAIRYGGPIVSVHGLCRGLAARGHEVHVFTTSVDGPADSPVAHDTPVDVDGVRVWYFRSTSLRRLYWSPAMRNALRSQLRTFDVLHTHAMFLWPGWAATRQAAAVGVPYVVSPRGMMEKDLIDQKSPLAKSLLIGLWERDTLERASGIHVTTSREQVELERFGFGLPRIYNIPNGIDRAPWHHGSELVAAGVGAEPFGLYLGRISWKKGLDRLIASLQHAPSLRIVVAGNDDEQLTPVLAAQAARLGVSDRVTFRGPVHGRAKDDLLSRASFLVLPSYSENFGNVLLEALTYERPVVMTPEVGLAAQLTSHGVGITVAGQPRLLGEAMAALDADPGLRAAMGRRGRQLIEEEFTWPGIASRIEQMYDEILARRAA